MKKLVDTVAFILHRDGRILAERRKADRATDPGRVALPGGHVEEGESFEQACVRELKEELGLDCAEFEFVARFLHHTDIEDQMTHYYSCEDWEGEPSALEAEEVFWVGFGETGRLDFEIDRKAAAKYIKRICDRKSLVN
jgi:mutator protein MutT